MILYNYVCIYIYIFYFFVSHDIIDIYNTAHNNITVAVDVVFHWKKEAEVTTATNRSHVACLIKAQHLGIPMAGSVV